MKRPIAIDLFAGAGGMSLGFEQAGFEVVAAVEIDPIHCAVHKFNFQHCAIIPSSVSDISAAKIRELAGIGNAKVDVVFGGAPCQGFSLIGQRLLDDPRNRLARDFLRLVHELDATSFVFENVKGLTLGQHRKFLEEFLVYAQMNGYQITLPWKVLDAAEFGVPQHRERLFIYGIKQGFLAPNYPEPTVKPADSRNTNTKNLVTGPTVSDAICDLPDAENFAELKSADCVRFSEWGLHSVYAKDLRCLRNNAWHYGYIRNWDPNMLTSSMRTEHSEISRRRFSETVGGNVEPISRFFRLPEFGLSNTLRAGTDGTRGAFTSPRPIHYRYSRCITVREMARIHGYPDWFRFHATKWHGARQIGNSVPPPLARSIATELLKALRCAPTKPQISVDLGSPSLLNLNLSQASFHFEMTRPRSGRDQKSGATKRKQSEIEASRLESAAY